MRCISREPNGAPGRQRRREAAKDYRPGDRVAFAEGGRGALEVVGVHPGNGTVRLRYPRGPRLTRPVPADQLVRAE